MKCERCGEESSFPFLLVGVTDDDVPRWTCWGCWNRLMEEATE